MATTTNPIDRGAEAHALAVTVETRIETLWKQRQRDRWRADWSPARHDRETELRALVRLRGSARRLARRTVEREDAATLAGAWEAWTEGEKVAAWGR